MKRMAGYRELERRVKGFANHHRIAIMVQLERVPGLSVEGISEKATVNYKTVSEHVRRLAHAGLVTKRNVGSSVQHRLTPRAVSVLKFLRTLE